MSRVKETNKINMLVMALVVLLVLLLILIINVVISNKRNSKTKDEKAELVGISYNKESIQVEADKDELQKIKGMNERTRIEYYVASYIRLIEGKDYEKAYNLLNEEYRKNYFGSSQKQFREYCENKFSSMMNVSYENFERNGDLYVVWLKINDAISGTKDEGLEITFVVKENTFNDYELSFSKI